MIPTCDLAHWLTVLSAPILLDISPGPDLLFVDPGPRPVWLQLAVQGFGIILVATLLEPLAVLASDRILRRMAKNASFRKWLDGTMGGIFIALGMRLAAERV